MTDAGRRRSLRATIVLLATALPAVTQERPGTARVLVGRDNWLFLRRSVVSWPPEVRRERARQAARDLAPAVRWLEARGTTVLLAPVPNKETMYPEKLPEGLAFHSPYGELVEELQRAGLWHVDLRDALRPGDPPSFLSSDTHWTSHGARRAMEAVGRTIAGRLGASIPGTPVRGRLVVRPRLVLRGDLAYSLPIAEGSREEQPFLVTVEEIAGVSADTGEPLAAHGPEPVVLMGTSMSADRGVGTILSAVLGRSVEQLTTEGQGAGAAFRRLAAEIASGARPAPRLAIWEMPERHAFDARLAPVLEEALHEAARASGKPPSPRRP